MAPPNADNFELDFVQNVFDEDTVNLLSLAELPFHIVSRDSILPELYATLPPAAAADRAASADRAAPADRATSPPVAMLLVNNPLYPRRAADGLPTQGFKETAEEEVLLLSDERRAQMAHGIDASLTAGGSLTHATTPTSATAAESPERVIRSEPVLGELNVAVDT